MPNKRIVCRSVTFLVAIVFFIVSSPSLSTAQEFSKERLNTIKRAIVIVTTYDDRGHPLVQGSGFFITPERVVTNFHVIDGANQIRITTLAGEISTVHTIAATDAKSDLALLQVNERSPGVLPLDIEYTAPIEGEQIVVVSNPLGFHWKVTHGRVGTVWQFENIGERLQITASILPGSSGGPVLNQQGRVIGVAVMHTGSADDLNFAVPANDLRALQSSTAVATNGVLDMVNQPR